MSKKFTILSFFIFMLVGVFYGVPQDKEFDRAKRIGDQIKVLETRHWDKAVDNLVQIGEPAVEPLIKAIKDNIKFISARSCYALARIGTSRAVTAVMEALKNPQGQIMVREYAADALGYVKSDESLQLLSDILINDGAAGVRRYAAKSLGKIGSERAVGTLLKALEDKNAWVRGTAAEALGKIHSPRAAASLVELLKSESDFVRVRTRNALVEIGKPAVESLLRSLEDTNTQVRWMAVWVLGHIRSSVVVLPLIQAIGDPDWMVRDEAALALAKIKKEDAVEPLVRLLQDDRAYVRCEAAWILGKMGAKKAVDPLIQALEDKEGGWMAATALGELKSEKALKPLITALKSKNLKLRRASAWALTKIRSEQAVNPLISVLSDEDDEVRMWAALALENIGTPQKKINELILKLGTEHWEEAIVALAELGDTQTQGYVYRGIVRGLAEIGSDQAEETLIKVVGQKDLSRLIRGPAAEALGRFQSDRTIAVLVKTLNDKDEFVRNFAGGALAKIGSKKAMEALFEGLRKNLGFLMNPFVREALEKDKSDAAVVILIEALQSDEWFVWQSASELLEKIVDRAGSRLIEALDSPNTRTRRKAAQLLGKSQSRKAVDRLIHKLEDPDWMVRDEAAVALAKIQSKKAVKPLVEAMQNGSPDFQKRICWIFGELKAEEAVESIILVLKNADREVQLWASSALEKINNPEAMKALQEISPLQISFRQKKYSLYPDTLDALPDIPSPYTTNSGVEIVVASTKDGKYALVPVTVENGTPYVYARSGRGKQLEIDSLDFPTLARSGLHSEEELNTTKTITGVSVSEITDIGRPGRSSGAGFMSEDEDIISVLKGDNKMVKKLGLTHPQLARALFHAINLVFKHTEIYYDKMRPWEDIEYFLYNGRKVFIEANTTKGWQESLFEDEIYGGYHIYIKREMNEKEKAFLEQKYPKLSENQMSELIEKLSNMHTGEMEPYYIMRYGFYEGHTEYRTDPLAIAFIFGLKRLEDIERAFPGKLFEVLTQHFTRTK